MIGPYHLAVAVVFQYRFATSGAGYTRRLYPAVEDEAAASCQVVQTDVSSNPGLDVQQSVPCAGRQMAVRTAPRPHVQCPHRNAPAGILDFGARTAPQPF